MFKEDKKKYLDALYKPDLSKKGFVDEKISDLINQINAKENYVTTSSCSGRIMLFIPAKIRGESEWPFVSHEEADVEEVWESLNHAAKNYSENIWFKMECSIIHVQCKTLESAQWLVTQAKEFGFKRSGIFVTKPECFRVEINSTEKVEMLAAKNREILINKEYLKVMVEEANKKLIRNHKKLESLKAVLQCSSS